MCFLHRNSLIVSTVGVAKVICYGRNINVNIMDVVYFHGRGYLRTECGAKEDSSKTNCTRDDIGGAEGNTEKQSTLLHVEIARERIKMWWESRVAALEVLKKTDDTVKEIKIKLKSNSGLQSGIQELQGV